MAIWGSTFVCTKLLLLSGLSPAQIFTLRFIIAYLLLLGYSLTRNHRWFSKVKSLRLNRAQSIGMVMAAVGVVIVVLNGHFVLHLSPLGDSLAFSAALCWGFYSLLMIPANMRYDTVFVTRKVFFYGLLAMIPYYLLKPDEAIIFTPAVVQFFNFPILLNLLFLGCVASMTCFLAWNWVLKKLGPVIATNYVYFNPVTTILFAWVVLSEQITIYFILGTILILAGLYLTEKKR